MFALKISFAIVLISGLIAYIGDWVGRSIGRKRLSLFNLRPRYTAIAVTVFTGMIIALLTGMLLFVSSADVRTAILGLDKLKGLISEKSRELEKIRSDRQFLLNEIASSKKEIEILTKTKDNLTNEIRTARQGQLAYRINDVITSAIVDSTGSPEQIKAKLLSLLAETDSAMKKAFGKKNKQLILMGEEELKEAVTYAKSNPGSLLIRIVSARNVMIGEVIPVHFELFQNSLIYKKNEMITNALINGANPRQEIEQRIKELLSEVNSIAMRKGIVPDATGSVGNIPYSKIFEMSKTIKAKNKTIKVQVISVKDTFSAGPLDIDLKISD